MVSGIKFIMFRWIFIFLCSINLVSSHALYRQLNIFKTPAVRYFSSTRRPGTGFERYLEESTMFNLGLGLPPFSVELALLAAGFYGGYRKFRTLENPEKVSKPPQTNNRDAGK
jgi:hypothetical protein